MHAKSAPSGNASQTVSRASGMRNRLRTTTTTSITAKPTRWVATIESGTSWRGKRTLRMRFAFSSRLRDDACAAVAKKTQAGRPQSRKQPVVAAPHLGDPPEERKNEQIHRHQDERVQERPREPEDRAAVLGTEIAAEEAPEELAIADYVGVNGYGEGV